MLPFTDHNMRMKGKYGFVVQFDSRTRRVAYFGPDTLWKIPEHVHEVEWEKLNTRLTGLQWDEHAWPLFVPSDEWDMLYMPRPF